jgi:hypothetical protein
MKRRIDQIPIHQKEFEKIVGIITDDTRGDETYGS